MRSKEQKDQELFPEPKHTDADPWFEVALKFLTLFFPLFHSFPQAHGFADQLSRLSFSQPQACPRERRFRMFPSDSRVRFGNLALCKEFMDIN